MKPSMDRLLELQCELAGAVAESNQVEEEARSSHERHNFLTQHLYALRARMDAAAFRAGDAKDTDAEVMVARANFQDLSARMAREVTGEFEKLQALTARLALVEAGIDEAKTELCGNTNWGVLGLIKAIFVALILAELVGVPVLKTIKEAVWNG